MGKRVHNVTGDVKRATYSELMKTLSEQPLLPQVRGQILVKRSRGEQSRAIAPLPAPKQLRGTQMRRKEVNVSENGTDILPGAKVQLGRRKKRKMRIIKFSFVVPGVMLFCRGIKWNGEVKKK